MELYGLPMAGSLAAHIVALEAELPVTVIYIDRKNPKTRDGGDFRTIAPHGYVPALRLPSGQVLNEGPAICNGSPTRSRTPGSRRAGAHSRATN